MLVTLAVWATLFALYLLFAGQATGAELCAAALSAAAGAAVKVHLHRAGHRPMQLDAPWGRLAGRIGASLARDTLAVGKALIRASMGRTIEGRAERQAFVVGDATETGRRAVVTLAASVAPNGFVETIAPGDGTLLVHHLVPTPPKEDRRWPV
jgi:hypothetical protein